MTRKSDFQQWFEARRDAAEKARAERKERRLIKTSTYDALMENVEDVEDGDLQIVVEDVLADTIAVAKRRWIERGAWITLAFITAGLGWVAGWYMQPEYEPKPVTCDVLVHGTTKETSVVRCTGVPE
jgi:hypothetical protein